MLSLCNLELSDNDKSEMAKALRNHHHPLEYKTGKPKFPTLTEKKKQLWEFIGPNSWFLLDRLGINTPWLFEPPSSWKNDEEFKRFEHFVTNLKVVNDCAERSIKDISEFKNSSKDPDQREYILQVVEYHRNKFSLKNVKKEELEKI